MNFLIYLLIICISMLPKINLISVGTSSAGIRIEDFLLAVICLFLFVYSKKNQMSKYYSDDFRKLKKIFYIYLLFSVISTLYGIVKGYISPLLSCLFVIRKLEYFYMFYIGYYYGKSDNLKNKGKLIDFIVYFHFGMCLLQMFGLVGSFNRGEMLDTLTQGRVSSTFNGAYELSAFLLLILPYYIYNLLYNVDSKLKNILNISLITFCIVMSMSRTSLVIEVVIVLYMIMKSKIIHNRKLVQKLLISGVCVLLPVLFVVVPKIDLSRFTTLSFSKTVYIFEFTWNYKNFDKYVSTGSWYGDSIYSLNQMDAMGYDGSLFQRVSHWMQLIDGWLSSPLIGTGVSISGNSADGNYIKILVETGLIGLVLWMLLLWKIYKILKRKNNWLIYSFITIVLGAIFIDLFDSSKVIMTFWLLLGIYLRSNYEEDKKCSDYK